MTLLRPIEPEGCGCEASEQRHGLISIDAALRRIAAEAAPVIGTETLALGQARGRILAEAVIARAAVPPFDNAAMDGYAIDCDALIGAGPWTLTVSDRIAAGSAARHAVSGAEAARIFTGAPMPDGADTVVMQEAVQRHGRTIRLDRRPKRGENVRRAGEDMGRGEIALRPGCRLGNQQIAVAAAAGAGTLAVRRKLRVALLVTGDELSDAGAAHLAAGTVWDVNGPLISAELGRPGIDLVAVEHGVDRPGRLARQLARLSAEADLVVSTGGISVGEKDHVRPAFNAAGGEVIFGGVAIKPGKPVSLGRLGGALWLGLPGNPLSAFVTFRLFGSALLRALEGETERGHERRNVVSATAIRRRPGRCELRPARLAGFDGQGREIATFEDSTHSARVARLHVMDGLVFLPAEADDLPAGSLVEFLPFDGPSGKMP
jgi:molybdopterin molybdotransferase